MSANDEEEERTLLNVEVDDPDATADRPRSVAELAGLIPSFEEPSTMESSPKRMRDLAQASAHAAGQEAAADDGSFVSDVSIVTQSAEVPSPVLPADAEPVTIEPWMGVRGIMSDAPRAPALSEASDATTANLSRAEALAAAAEARAKVERSVPRPAAGVTGARSNVQQKRQRTTLGLGDVSAKAQAAAVDDKEADTQTDMRIDAFGHVPPATEPLPTAPRPRTNSEEALIAHALAFAPTDTTAPEGLDALPSTQERPARQTLPLAAAPMTNPVDAQAPMPAAAQPPALARTLQSAAVPMMYPATPAGSFPALSAAPHASSSHMRGARGTAPALLIEDQPPPPPAPRGLAVEAASPPRKSKALLSVGLLAFVFVVGGGAGFAVLRARAASKAQAAAKTAAVAASASASASASAEPVASAIPAEAEPAAPSPSASPSASVEAAGTRKPDSKTTKPTPTKPKPKATSTTPPKPVAKQPPKPPPQPKHQPGFHPSGI